jgi:hypothetical protein
MMKTKDSLKAAMNFDLTTRLHIPGDGNGNGHPSWTLKSHTQEQNMNKISRVTAPALRNVKVPGSNLCPRSSFLKPCITVPQSVKKHDGIILNPKEKSLFKKPHFLQLNPGVLPNTQDPRFITPVR